MILTLLARFWYVIPILALMASTAYYKHDAKNEHTERVKVEAAFELFKAEVEQVGRAQEAKTKATIANQERISNETKKSADARVAGILDRYKRMLNTDKGNSGSGQLPAVPDTTRPVDDSARDQRLLEVLRAADLQTGTLIDLQNWVKSQASK